MKPLNNIDKPLESKDGKGLMADLEKIEFDVQQDLLNSLKEMYEKIMDYLYTHGVWPENDAREPWFLCESHTDEIIDETLNKFEDAVKSAKD